jgi:hypothetical protein
MLAKEKLRRDNDDSGATETQEKRGKKALSLASVSFANAD